MNNLFLRFATLAMALGMVDIIPTPTTRTPRYADISREEQQRRIDAAQLKRQRKAMKRKQL